MDGAGSNPTEDLARELWQAFAARARKDAPPPSSWEAMDAYDRQTWMMLARVAVAHRAG